MLTAAEVDAGGGVTARLPRAVHGVVLAADVCPTTAAAAAAGSALLQGRGGGGGGGRLEPGRGLRTELTETIEGVDVGAQLGGRGVPTGGG